MTNIFMKGDLDDMIFEGTDWQPSERKIRCLPRRRPRQGVVIFFNRKSVFTS